MGEPGIGCRWQGKEKSGYEKKEVGLGERRGKKSRASERKGKGKNKEQKTKQKRNGKVI